MNDKQVSELSIGWEQRKILKRASTNAEISKRIGENYFLAYGKDEDKKIHLTEYGTYHTKN